MCIGRSLRLPAVGMLLLSQLATSGWCEGLERQVPLDQRGRVGVMDARLARRLDLFVREHPGFVEARLLMTEEGAHVLELLLRDQGGVMRSRIPFGTAQVDSLRALVQGRVDAIAPEAGRNQEGRAWMLAGDALMGWGFYGWAVPVMFNAQDGQTAVGSYLVTAGLAYFVPFVVTRDRDITYAMANLGFYGQTRGAAHGALLVDALDSASDDEGNRRKVAAAFVTSVAEGAVGTAWASASSMTAGRAATLVTGGDFGAAYALCLTSVGGGFEGDDDAPVAAAATLGGTAVGLLAANVLASHRDYSYGDAGVMRVGGITGGFLGASLTWLAEDVDPRASAGAFVAGSAVGLVVGDRVVRGAGYSGTDNVLSHFSAGAGALLGLGVGFLAVRGGDERVLGLTSALGSVGGWALSVSQLARLEGRRPRPVEGAFRPRAEPRVRFAWNLEPRLDRDGSGSHVVPHVRVRASF